jgi:predicted dehydrogenase
MITSCREAGVLLNVNENWRWRSWYRKLRDLVKDRLVGSPVYVRIFSHGSSRLPGNTKPGHRFLSWPRVILFDWIVHHVDIYRFLFGEPLNVFAHRHRLNANLVGEDRVVVVLN